MTTGRSSEAGNDNTYIQPKASWRGDKNPPWKVLLADDHPTVREGIGSVLYGKDNLFQVVGEAQNGQEAVDKATVLQPDVVIMDVRMPEMDGITACGLIKQANPEIPVMFLTTHANMSYFQNAMRAGAADYVLKDAHPDQMVKKVTEVILGTNTFDPAYTEELLTKLLEESREAIDSEEPPAWIKRAWSQQHIVTDPKNPRGLTERERNVLQHIARSHTNAKIAAEEFISESTVKNYVESIFRKLEVSDRTQACLQGIALDYLEAPLPSDRGKRIRDKIEWPEMSQMGSSPMGSRAG